MPKIINAMRKVALTATAIAASGSMFAAVPAGALEASDRAEVEKIVREYLLANPEIMLEVQKALEAKQEAARAEAQARTLTEMKDAIYASANDVKIGPDDAPITIVEFYDYNCGFCHRALADMDRLVSESGGAVRFILKEFPVLGEASLAAHKVSIAFARLMPEKSAEFHRTLLAMEGRKDGDVARQLAIQLGADGAALDAEIAKPDLLDHVRETYKLADGLGINGTPSYIIGEEVVPGAVGFDQLSIRVANVQQCGKATC